MSTPTVHAPVAAPRQLHASRLFDGERLRQDLTLHLDGGRIVALTAEAPDTLPADTPRVGAGWLLTPGLVDLQVNGGGGVMFDHDASPHGAARIAQAHARRGTTGLLLTLITESAERRRQALATVRQARNAGLPGVLGLHLEGPFIQPARKGIHRAELITAMTPADADDIAAFAGSTPCLVTLAPECVPTALIRRLSDAGARVFAGHTEARYDEVLRAVHEGGLCGFTHLFNAMSQLGPRAAGTVGAALLHPELWAGLILDGHHVSPESARIAWRLRGGERLLLVSDAMAPAGTADTAFLLQGQPIQVRDGRCEDEAGTLAGAAICLADAVRLAVQHYGLPPEAALHGATAGPATLLGIDDRHGRLAPGAAADLVVFDAGLRVRGVMQAGRWLVEPPLAALQDGGMP